MSFLKPKAPKSSSSNINNSLITSTYGGQMQQGTGATNFLAQLLGVSPGGVASTAAGGAPTGYDGSGNPAIINPYIDGPNGRVYMHPPGGASSGGGGSGGDAQAGYQNYLQMAGYAPAMRQMSQGVVGQGAASGMLNSGATARALQTRGAEINQGYFNNYLEQLRALSGLGLQAGGLVANTGQVSKNSGGGPSTAGSVASTIGGIASIFSDRRLKRDIERVGEFADGLGIYTFRYVMHAKRVLGVMADEVAKLRPHALGPVKGGFATVNYGAL